MRNEVGSSAIQLEPVLHDNRHEAVDASCHGM
jgi:hypothetical protein